MKVDISKLVESIKEEKYKKYLVSEKASSLKGNKLADIVDKMVSQLVDDINAGYIVQSQFAVEGRKPITFGLETNVINLPFANGNKIEQFFVDTDEAELKLYLTISSDYINVSRFRIDEVVTTDDAVANPDKLIADLTEKFSTVIETIKDAELPTRKTAAAEEKPAAKTTTKKTTRKAPAKRKTAAKKTTTKRKTTTKKATK